MVYIPQVYVGMRYFRTVLDTWDSVHPKKNHIFGLGIVTFVTIILRYVDDFIISSKYPNEIIDKLQKKYLFKLKVTGNITYHLGMDFHRDKYCVLCMLSNTYIQNMCDAYQMNFGINPNKKYLCPLEVNDNP